MVALAVAAVFGAAPALSGGAPRWDFVTRSGSHLMLGGKPFRFAGANVEWLGLIGYGPLNFAPAPTEVFPSHYQINDALATAKEMGATVIRAQTLGDTVGCSNCLEPTLGQFNPNAFRVMDYVIARARAYGIRLILEFQGDARAEHVSSSADIFQNWRGGASFWTDPVVIGDFENHIAQIVDHVNTYTGIAYRDDPTILGWMDCNACQPVSRSATDTWVRRIADYVKLLDPNHLFISNAATFAPDQQLLSIPSVDAYSAEIYPHWYQGASGDPVSGEATEPHQVAANTAAAGKVWLASEFGWDRTDWETPAALQNFLSGIVADPNISGDLFWALYGHNNGHGWDPLPANELCQPGEYDTSPPVGPSPGGSGCDGNEDGNWWALYYPGIGTISNLQADMTERAQLLREHAYQMAGLPLPPHQRPPAPIITAVQGRLVFWEGSAGAGEYSIETQTKRGWSTRCNRCVTDDSDGWLSPVRARCYRVIPFNLDNVSGVPSTPAGSDCRRRRARHDAHARPSRTIGASRPEKRE